MSDHTAAVLAAVLTAAGLLTQLWIDHRLRRRPRSPGGVRMSARSSRRDWLLPLPLLRVLTRRRRRRSNRSLVLADHLQREPLTEQERQAWAEMAREIR